MYMREASQRDPSMVSKKDCTPKQMLELYRDYKKWLAEITDKPPLSMGDFHSYFDDVVK